MALHRFAVLGLLLVFLLPPVVSSFYFEDGSAVLNISSLTPATARWAYSAVFSYSFWHSRPWGFAMEDFSANSTTYGPGTYVSTQPCPSSYCIGASAHEISNSIFFTPVRIAILASSVNDSGGQSVNWEEGYYERFFRQYLGGEYYFTRLSEAQIASGTLANYDVLILPAITEGYESNVSAALGPAGFAQLNAFVRAHGFLLSSGNANLLVEQSGLAGNGTLSSVTIPPSTQNLSAIDDSPLLFNWNSAQFYVLDDVAFNSSAAAAPNATVIEVANFNAPGEQWDNLSAILAISADNGTAVMLAGHPAVVEAQYPVLLNAMFFAMGTALDVRGNASQNYSASVASDTIPAYEANVSVHVTESVSNFANYTILSATLVERIPPSFELDNGSLVPADAAVSSSGGYTYITWVFNQTENTTLLFNYTVRTHGNTTASGRAEVSRSTLSYFDGNGEVARRRVSIAGGPLYVNAKMAAQLVGDRDIELDGVYPIPASGWWFDMALPLENKEETNAKNITYVEVVPLISPQVDCINESKVSRVVAPDYVNASGMYYNYTFWNSVSHQLESKLIHYFNSTDPNGITWVRNDIHLYSYAGTAIPYYTLANWSNGDGCPDLSGEALPFPAPSRCSLTTWNYTSDGLNLTGIPALKMEWDYGELAGYDFQEPAIRYMLFSQANDTVCGDGTPGSGNCSLVYTSDPDYPPEILLDGGCGSVYTALGVHPIPHHEYLNFAEIYIPVEVNGTIPAMHYFDIWDRNATLEMRTTFYDNIPFPPPEEHAVSTTTYELLVNNTRVLEWPVHQNATVHYKIAVHNGYPPYDPVTYPYNMTIPMNESLIVQRVFKGLGYQMSIINYTTIDDNPNVNFRAINETEAYWVLFFNVLLPPSMTQFIDVFARMSAYPGIHKEGVFKLDDGARFTYHQIAVGPNRYEVSDSRVKAAWGQSSDLIINKTVYPTQVGSYGDELYHFLELSDPYEPRVYSPDAYLRSYGFGEQSANTYVGARIRNQLYYPVVSEGENTIIRIEVDNNAPGNVTGFNITPVAPAGVEVTPLYFATPADLPIFYDWEFLGERINGTILPAWKGVYYFNATITDSALDGSVAQVNFTATGDGLVPGFTLPPALVGVKFANGSYPVTVYGNARNLSIRDTMPQYVSVLDARIATTAQRNEMYLYATNGSTHSDAAAYFATLTELNWSQNGSIFTAGLEQVVPGDANPLYVIVRTNITPNSSGYIYANVKPTVFYTDDYGYVENSSAANKTVYARGPAPTLSSSVVAWMPRVDNSSTTANLTAGTHYFVNVTMVLRNLGNDIAQAVNVSVRSGHRASFRNETPVNGSPFEYSENITIWHAGDLAPGAVRTVVFPMEITPANVNLETIVNGSTVYFVDTLLAQPVEQSYGPITISVIKNSSSGSSRDELVVSALEDCPNINVSVSRNGEPVSGAEVHLLSGWPHVYTVTINTTNSNGMAQFQNVGTANYQIYALAGVMSDEVEIAASCTPVIPINNSQDAENASNVSQALCLFNSQCPSDQYCDDLQGCILVNCSCGTVENHACVNYACCSDSECLGSACVSHSCVQNSGGNESEAQKLAAQQALDAAGKAIEEARKGGLDATSASAKYQEAVNAFGQGNYVGAEELAKEALALLKSGSSPNQPGQAAASQGQPVDPLGVLYFALLAILLVAAVVAVAFLLLRKKKA